MGLIKALAGAVGGGLADQWLEVLEADDMGDNTVFTKAVALRSADKRSSNKKGSADVISDGSVIHVYPNQFLILTDGGRVVDYTAEPGYYKVSNSSMPSLFNGQFGDALKETFSRFKYGGVPSSSQKAYFINLQEIKGIKFGTRAPVNYFDNFYNSELFLRAFGTYSVQITDPIKFYTQVVPKNSEHVEINEINEQYLSEFLEAFGAAINRMSADGIRISFVTSKGRELSKYMSDILDEEWKTLRGFEVLSVGIANLSYDEESQKLINMRNQGAMLSDPSVREGYVQGAVARGIESAGSNSAGAAMGFMGVGMGTMAGGGFMEAASASNRAQMEKKETDNNSSSEGWKCECGAVNNGKFCPECGKAKPEAKKEWRCACGALNTGKFCSECGAKGPEKWFCSECGAQNSGKFCAECGAPRP